MRAGRARRRACRRADRQDPTGPRGPPAALAIAVAAGLAVAAHWAMGTQLGLDIGMYLPNTTWHNAPFAARFVQDAQLGGLHFTEALRLTVWFYPQNSELLHSAGILFIGSDFLSPLINIGWMALCLLAAWCFGRPYGAAAAAVLALAVILDAEMLLLYQPGDAKNDIGGLSSCSRRLRSWSTLTPRRAPRPGRRGPSWAGPGARPAAPARRADRRRAGCGPGARHQAQPARALRAAHARGDRGRRQGTPRPDCPDLVRERALHGGFWFARNLVEAGNPLPWADAGPLPGPQQLDIDEPHTVSDYLTNAGVISDYFIRAARQLRRPLAARDRRRARGAALAVWRGRTSMLRMLGVVALLSGLAYLFTPDRRARSKRPARSRSTSATRRPASPWGPAARRGPGPLPDRVRPYLLGGSR